MVLGSLGGKLQRGLKNGIRLGPVVQQNADYRDWGGYSAASFRTDVRLGGGVMWQKKGRKTGDGGALIKLSASRGLASRGARSRAKVIGRKRAIEVRLGGQIVVKGSCTDPRKNKG